MIVPPLSLQGTAISIRKFSEKPITLDMLKGFGSMSEKMCTALKIAGACRMNVVISGGTGSGKTTMLNAMSKMIDPGERVLTIEDAAELRLQQPHWLPLETRPPNLEGQGAITIGDLVKNALRMRPDRIILGEIRGAECFDLLAAMNTGHDGSMCTLHANSPRECLGRMENMILMGDIKIPKEAISRQIAESVDLIVQVKRLRDGSRRTTNITEVIGMEGDVIVTQELFKFEYLDEDDDGKIIGEYPLLGPAPLHAREGAPVRLRPGLSRGLPLDQPAGPARRSVARGPRPTAARRRSPPASGICRSRASTRPGEARRVWSGAAPSARQTPRAPAAPPRQGRAVRRRWRTGGSRAVSLASDMGRLGAVAIAGKLARKPEPDRSANVV